MRKRITLVFFAVLLVFAWHDGGLAQSQSEYALISRPVFQNPPIYRWTKSASNTYWGIDLFGELRALGGSYIVSPDLEPYSTVGFFLDQDWDRMLYIECYDLWIRAYGQSGGGTAEFFWPRSLDALAPCDEEWFSYYYFIYIADTENDRIVKLKYDWRPGHQSMTYDGAITGGGSDRPVDLDLNNNFDFWPDTNDYLWVINQSSQMKRFTTDGVLHNTYGTFGCWPIEGCFCHPRAVVCGRSPWLQDPYDPFANNDHIYVADAGNGRIVWLIKWHGAEQIEWWGEIPASSSIVDLEVDNFGQLWAVDRELGRLTKYSYDLYPLCTFGGSGTGDKQFWKPISMSNSGGYLGFGDTHVAEAWTDSSGGQFFVIGTDVLDLRVTSSGDHYWHYIDYTLIEPSVVSIKIYSQESALMKTLFYGLEFSGPCAFFWDGSDDMGEQVATGDYRIAIVDSSLYRSMTTGAPANVVSREAWVHHEHNPDPPTYIPGDANNSGGVEVGDIVFLISYLYKNGPAPAPVCIGDVNDDGVVNVGDVCYLVTFLFKGGPAPLNGCD